MVTSHVHVTFKTNYTLISNVKYSDFPINMMKISHSRMTPPFKLYNFQQAVIMKPVFQCLAIMLINVLFVRLFRILF